MTLTQAAKFTKIAVFLLTLSIVASSTFYIGYKIWYTRYLASLPPVEEKPDPKFGILKTPYLPASAVSSSNFSYSIDTATGNLPLFEKIAKIFIMPPNTITLLAGEKSQGLAQKFNLDPTPQILSETKYKYVNPNASLTVDLDTGNFSYTKEATKSATATIEDSNDQLTNGFKITLNSLGILPDMLKNGPTKVIFLDQNKHTAQISLWPQDIDKKPVLTADRDKALVRAQVIQSANDLGSYISLNFTFWPVDTTSYATYPLKSTQEAFDGLRSGQGAILVTPTSAQVSIVNIFLAYYQSDQYSPYLQPIYVFEGPNFLAFVPAITDSFLNLSR